MTWISNPTPVAEPGMWHLQTEAEGYIDFVHRRTGEVTRSRKAARKKTSRTKTPKTTSARIRRPSLPELGAWRSAAWENSSRGPATNHSSVCAARDDLPPNGRAA